jgi:hypothetical protein
VASAEKAERAGRNIILNQNVIFGTEPELFERDEFDCIDLRSMRSLEPRTPRSFGGMSGATLWRFQLPGCQFSEMNSFDFQLAGVPFYQLADSEDGMATVLFHGPCSIYERLLPRRRHYRVHSLSSDEVFVLRQ